MAFTASVEQYISGADLRFEYSQIRPGVFRRERAAAFLCRTITEEITGLPMAESDPGSKLLFGFRWEKETDSEVLRLNVTAPHDRPSLNVAIMRGDYPSGMPTFN